MHVGGVELCHHDRICPGRVGHAEPEDAVLKPCGGVDGREPVKRLVALLVGVTIPPVDDLLGRDCLLPYEIEVQSG